MIKAASARASLGILLSLLAALALGVVVTPSADATGGPPVPVLDWKPCGAEFLAGTVCAHALVPLDYDRPNGRTTYVALAKLPAADQAHRIGTVFVNVGGPGNSGIDIFRFPLGGLVAEQLDGRFDVIGFDPRGVGASDPLHCFDSEDEVTRFASRPPVFPYQRAQERPFFDHWRSLGPECLDDRQAIARHMSTADVARDLDLLRRAVGDRQLTYLGFSWGTFLGATYANLFPGRVRAMVFDGVLDPRLWSTGRLIQVDRTGPQAVLDEALRLCDLPESACAFSAPGGSRARWEALAQRIRRSPVVVSPELTYTYDLLIADAAGVMYAPEFWSEYSTFLDGVADVALGGQPPDTTLTGARSRLRVQLAASGREATYYNGFDAFYSSMCSDAEYPKRLSGWRATARYAERGSRIGPRWWWIYAGCANWPVAPDRYTGPWSARTSAPVLLVGTYFDAGTDYAMAEATNKLMPNSRLLSYAGWGHTAYERSECISAYVNRYLVTGTPPPQGTVCPAGPNPFTTTTAQRRAPSRVHIGLPPTGLGDR